jgi:hypothetical protein
VHAGRDYVTLCGGDGLSLHLPLHHIRSVTPVPDPGPEYPPPDGSAAAGPETFSELLAGLVGEVVRIHHAGPEVTVGTLVAATDEYLLTEIAPEGQVCHVRFHVRSLSRLPDQHSLEIARKEP